MRNNKGDTMGKRFYYFVVADEGRVFFETSDKFLQFLRDNDPTESGAEELTESQWKRISAAHPDEMVNYQDET